MRKALVGLAAVALLATAGMTACSMNGNAGTDGSGGGGKGAKVGVILPDVTSGQRWRTDDPQYLKKAFEAANVPVDIQNAQGDKTRFATIADRMIGDGVKVLMIVNLDSPSGADVLAKARAAGVKTIDYDRLTLGGGADYYVSYDSVRAGSLQGFGLVKCLEAKGLEDPVVAELNGAPTDTNATLLKQGYDSVLQERYDNATLTKGPDQSVPDWDTTQAAAIFTQMLDLQPRIRAVLAANDALAGAVINVLRKRGLNGKVPVTGQDATIQGLQNILVGDQCMTVYKPIEPEAQTAANLAISLYQGQQPAAVGTIKDPESSMYIPFLRLQPRAINIDSIQELVNDGFVSTSQLCAGMYEPLCQEHEIQ